MKSVWSRIPQQIRHLLVPLLIVILGFLLIRHLFVPPTFGIYGHYRGASVVQNAAQEIKYGGSEVCTECHDALAIEKKSGYHRMVACETCHGPSAEHIQDPEKVKPRIPRSRTHCLLCHEYLVARPTGFPQVVSDSHNPVKSCIVCHGPHDPKPPNVPTGCDACHAKVQRTIVLSRHSSLQCTSCHEAPKEHKINPRGNKPKRMQDRQSCGKCHSKESTAPKEVLRVNMATHGEKYLCWQCHYPHQPEAH
jgi:ribosomal protein S27AE